MKLEAGQEIKTDVLVIGGGAAGLRAAIAAKKHNLSVILLSESPVGFRNNTAISRAVFAASGIRREPGDSPESHLEDIITGGRFINDRGLVRTLTQAVSQQVDDLAEFGVSFRQRDGELQVGLAPGHTHPRQVAIDGYRGINITRPMRRYAAEIGVRFIEGVVVARLLKAGDRVVGTLGIDDEGQLLVIGAKSTVLATGGGGRVYLRTNNAVGLTGDGYALAYEAGAVLRDMEFVQFYPTAYGEQGSKMCMYESFLPAGAVIRNSHDEDILERHRIDVASATRDVLTRTIMEEIAGGRGVQGSVVFDFTTIPQDRVPALSRSNMTRRESRFENLPVAPTVHFFMGGIKINEKCETGIGGLYGAGEVCGGIHGANRLGGNAIGETLVFGTIAGGQAATSATKMQPVPAKKSEVRAGVERLKELASGTGKERLDEVEQSLRQTMWDKVGVIRDKQSLKDAQKEISALGEQLTRISLTDRRQLPRVVKVANMLTVADIICRAALMRTESRGAHYRSDCPGEDNQRWLKNVEIACQNGEMVLKAIPVPQEVGS